MMTTTMEPAGRRGEPVDVYDASGSKPLTPPANKQRTTASTTTSSTTTTASTSHVDDVMEWLDQKTKLGQAKAGIINDIGDDTGGYSEEDTDDDEEEEEEEVVSGGSTNMSAITGPPSFRSSDSSQPTQSSRRSAEPPGLYLGAMMMDQHQQEQQQQQRQQLQQHRPMMMTNMPTAEAVAMLVPGISSGSGGDPSGSNAAAAPQSTSATRTPEWVNRKTRRESKAQAAACNSAGMHQTSIDDDEITAHVVDGKLAPDDDDAAGAQPDHHHKNADPPADDVETGEAGYSESIIDSQHEEGEAEEEVEDGEKYIKAILDPIRLDTTATSGQRASSSDAAAAAASNRRQQQQQLPPGAYNVRGRQTSVSTGDSSSSAARRASEGVVHIVPTAVLVSSSDDDDNDEDDHQDRRRRGGDHIQVAAVVARGDSTTSRNKPTDGASGTPFFANDSRNRTLAIVAFFVVLGLVVIGVVVALVGNPPPPDDSTDAEATANDDLWYNVMDPIDGSPGSEFGSSVSMCSDGSRVAIGAQGSGEVVVYELDSPIPGGRKQIGQTILHNVTQNMSVPFTRSQVVVELARNCKVLAIGYPFENVGDKKMAGQVELYNYDAFLDSWVPLGDPHIIPGEEASDFAGASISLSQAGDRIAIGSPGNDYAGTDAGRARVFLVNRGGWELLGTAINGTLPGEELGGSISLTSHESAGTYIMAVGLRTTPSEGYVYTLSVEVARVYEFQTGTWSERGQGVAPDVLGIDTAWFVKLSSDGQKLVVSNLYMDPEGVRVLDGEVNAGIFVAAYDLDWKIGKWVPRGGNIHANFPGKKSGYVIALSDDGSRIGMGDPGRAEAGGLAGHSHFYEFIEDQWCQLGPNIHGESAGDMAGYSVSMSGDGKRMV
jgi:hypothetical protein